jgi:hypothetical protein
MSVTNTASVTVSSEPRLLKQAIFNGYKRGRKVRQPLVVVRPQCWCGLSFHSETALLNHLNRAHPIDGDSA